MYSIPGHGFKGFSIYIGYTLYTYIYDTHTTHNTVCLKEKILIMTMMGMAH